LGIGLGWSIFQVTNDVCIPASGPFPGNLHYGDSVLLPARGTGLRMQMIIETSTGKVVVPSSVTGIRFTVDYIWGCCEMESDRKLKVADRKLYYFSVSRIGSRVKWYADEFFTVPISPPWNPI